MLSQARAEARMLFAEAESLRSARAGALATSEDTARAKHALG